jgi:hypothetical protein
MAVAGDAGDIDYPYEASDEASESELLDRSLSVWKGWSSLGCTVTEQFTPIDLDLHTAASIGQYQCVKSFVDRFVLICCFLIILSPPLFLSVALLI